MDGTDTSPLHLLEFGNQGGVPVMPWQEGINGNTPEKIKPNDLDRVINEFINRNGEAVAQNPMTEREILKALPLVKEEAARFIKGFDKTFLL
jgi:hypothetical protein